MPSSRRQIAVLALIGLVALAGFVVGVVAFDSFLDPFDDLPFDSAVWIAADANMTEQDRGPMARDAARHLPIGTPVERVRELLGEPSWEAPPGGDRWGAKPRHGGATWVYVIGNWSGIGPYGFDAAFLYVHLDREGRVASTEVTGG